MQNIAGLLLGVGLFLFGIDMMGSTAESLYSEKMKQLIEKLTKNRLTAVLTGTLVTGVIQSSCAATVMTLGFVSSGMMTLTQAVGVIMGANIGTTVTSLLLTIRLSSLAPFAVFAGVMIKLFCKSKKAKTAGLFLACFGLMFSSMSIMEEYMSRFASDGTLKAFLGESAGRTKSLAAGFLVTSIMQSSSASVGLLQSAAKSGLVSTQNAVYILFGQNIGAVVPTLIASLRCDEQAKKAAFIHLLFNFLGTMMFILITELTPYARLLDGIGDPKLRISAAHIIFNVASTLALLPFSDFLVKLSDKAVSRSSP